LEIGHATEVPLDILQLGVGAVCSIQPRVDPIEDANAMASEQERIDNMRSDETGTTDDQAACSRHAISLLYRVKQDLLDGLSGPSSDPLDREAGGPAVLKSDADIA
jgi:hypothetical protein